MRGEFGACQFDARSMEDSEQIRVRYPRDSFIGGFYFGKPVDCSENRNALCKVQRQKLMFEFPVVNREVIVRSIHGAAVRRVVPDV